MSGLSSSRLASLAAQLLHAIVLAVGYLAALACAVTAMFARRLGASVAQPVRFVLDGFAAFFCPQLIVFGLSDWSPLPLLGGVAWCWACGLSVVWLTRGPQQVPEASPSVA